jgi:hypothetical protein
MARTKGNDFFTTLRAQGLRKRVAKALSDLETTGRGAGRTAEARAREAIRDLRAAADAIEKRLDIGGSGTRSRAAKKAAQTRKAGAAKRSAAAKKGAAKRRTTTRRTTKRRTTARKSSS